MEEAEFSQFLGTPARKAVTKRGWEEKAEHRVYCHRVREWIGLEETLKLILF